MKIAVYAISKNEEQFVSRFCKSAELADYIVIADTGSTDNTVNIAKECQAIVHSICIKPWRFDKARDAFIPPQPFASWLLNESSCLWNPPVPYPDDGNAYEWDEPSNNWLAV